jgi:hypothetical protein
MIMMVGMVIYDDNDINDIVNGDDDDNYVQNDGFKE